MNDLAVTNFNKILKNQYQAFASYLPNKQDLNRFCRALLNQIKLNPKLLEKSSLDSIILAAMEGARLNLEVGTQFYIIPYRGTAKFLIGYQGMLDLMRRSPFVANIDCHLIRKNDVYSLELGQSPKLEHKILTLDRLKRGEIIGVYAIAWLTLPGKSQAATPPVISFLDQPEVDEIKSDVLNKIRRPEDRADNPWVKYYGEMTRKTAIRRLSKYAPKKVRSSIESLCSSEDEFCGLSITKKAEEVVDVSTISGDEQQSIHKSNIQRLKLAFDDIPTEEL